MGNYYLRDMESLHLLHKKAPYHRLTKQVPEFQTSTQDRLSTKDGTKVPSGYESLVIWSESQLSNFAITVKKHPQTMRN